MATDLPYFSINNPEQCEWDGKYAAKDSDELATGLIGKITTDGAIDLAGASDDHKNCGIVFTNRTLVYAPTEAYADAGEPVTFVRGSNIKFVASAEYFEGATLPSAGADLYLAANGKLDVTGSVFVGRIFGAADSVRAIPNTTRNVVFGELSFTPV